MRLVVVGASQFGEKCLRLAGAVEQVEIVGVVTSPRNFKISYRPEGVTNALHSDLALTAAELGVPAAVMTTHMSDPELLSQVRDWNPDLFLVAGWYHMIPRSWRSIAPAYGLHASLLPDYSGGAPLVWALINGETETGITLFQMDDGVDSGPIVSQQAIPILKTDTIATLYQRAECAGLGLLLPFLSTIGREQVSLRPQFHPNRRIVPQRQPDDGQIDWRLTSIEIDRFVRAQTDPYPGAFSVIDKKRIGIFRVGRLHSKHQMGKKLPGQVALSNGAVLVETGDGFLKIVEIEYLGKRIGGNYLSSFFVKLNSGVTPFRFSLPEQKIGEFKEEPGSR